MKSTERTRREWSKMLQESMKDVEYGDENTLEIKHRMKYTNKWQTEIKQKGCVAEGKKTSFSNLKPDLRVHYTDRTFKVKCNWNKTAKQRNQYVFRDDGNFVNSRQHYIYYCILDFFGFAIFHFNLSHFPLSKHFLHWNWDAPRNVHSLVEYFCWGSCCSVRHCIRRNIFKSTYVSRILFLCIAISIFKTPFICVFLNEERWNSVKIKIVYYIRSHAESENIRSYFIL